MWDCVLRPHWPAGGPECPYERGGCEDTKKKVFLVLVLQLTYCTCSRIHSFMHLTQGNAS